MTDELLEQMEEDADAAFAGIRTREIAEKAHALVGDIEAMEEQLSVMKKELEKLMTGVLPRRMIADGISAIDWKDENGNEIRLMLEDKVVGSLNYAEDEDAAIAYLEAEGFSGVTKTVLSTEFAEEERDKAYQALEVVQKDIGRQFYLKRVINPQSLMAFGRARIKENPNFDFKLVGLNYWPQTKFTKR
jgi:hypothetical protein